MSSPLRNVAYLNLVGHGPRHVIDFDVDRLAVPEAEVEAARRRLERAVRLSEQRAEQMERQVHELACIEDAQQAGAFRRLLAVAVLAVDVQEQIDKLGQRGAWPYLVATHRAVEERWVGATYDLSNCLATLTYLPLTQLDLDRALGTWVWLNLAALDRSHYYRWVISTRRFETILLPQLLAHFQAAEEVEPAAKGEPSPWITEDRARGIAEAHLQFEGVAEASGRVLEVVKWAEITDRRPQLYGKDERFWEKHWIVYLERSQPRDRMTVGPSLIMAIHVRTGKIAYVGSANDEG